MTASFPIRSMAVRKHYVRDRDECPECGGDLDTGWECTECGADFEDIGYTEEDKKVYAALKNLASNNNHY